MDKNEIKATKFIFGVLIIFAILSILSFIFISRSEGAEIYSQYTTSTNNSAVASIIRVDAPFTCLASSTGKFSFSPFSSGLLGNFTYILRDSDTVVTSTDYVAEIYNASNSLLKVSASTTILSGASMNTTTFAFDNSLFLSAGISYKWRLRAVSDYEPRSPFPVGSEKDLFIRTFNVLSTDCPTVDLLDQAYFRVNYGSTSTVLSNSSYSIAQGMGTNLLFPYASSTLGGFNAFKLSYFGINNDPYSHLRYQVVYSTSSNALLEFSANGILNSSLGKRQNEVLDRTINSPPVSYLENSGVYVKYLYGGNATNSLDIFQNLPVGTYYARSFVYANSSSSDDIIFSDLIAYSNLISFTISSSGTIVNNLPSNYYEDILATINPKATSTEAYLLCQPPSGITDIGGGLVYAGCWAINQLITPHSFTSGFFDDQVNSFKTVFPFSIAFTVYDSLNTGIDSIESSTMDRVYFKIPDLYHGALSTSTRTVSLISTSSFNQFNTVDPDNTDTIKQVGRYIMVFVLIVVIFLQIVPKRKKHDY